LDDVDGGVYTMGMAYLAAWQGPVYESQDPYWGHENSAEKSPSGLKAVKHVQDMEVIEGKDFKTIKESVFKYGGVQTSIYNSFASPAKATSYNPATFAYSYVGTENPNHDVLIIGWDDTFSKEKFKVQPEADGAFLCQNSWGSGFGNNGYFYISYYDVHIGTHNVCYTGIEDVDNYDHIYQSDLCGWVGQLGYGNESAYGANVYTSKGAQTLRAAGFYTTGTNTEYRLYTVKNFQGIESLENRDLVAEGKITNAGYHTVNFNLPIAIENGEKYALVLYISTPGAENPLAIEYKVADDDFTKNVIIEDGQAYVSSQGTNWKSLEQMEEPSNLCLKAYSDDRN
jgi:hypothetical protein